VHVGGEREQRLRIAGHADQLDPEALDQRQQGDDFGGGAGVRQRQHHVIAGDHAHVAMAGFGRVDEERRGAGARQGGGDLAADVAGLAHAEHHHAPLAGEDQLAGSGEFAVETGQQALDRFDFQADRALGRLDQVVRWSHGRRRFDQKGTIIPAKAVDAHLPSPGARGQNMQPHASPSLGAVAAVL